MVRFAMLPPMAFQLFPKFVDEYNPPPKVAAYRLRRPSEAIAEKLRFYKPESASVQLPPLSCDRNNPCNVPTNNPPSFIAKPITLGAPRSPFRPDHDFPESEEKRIDCAVPA